MYGHALTGVLPAAANELLTVEVDWLRVRPVVKVIGEFWAQMTESDGNFRMLEFLEKEGTEASIEPVSTWLLYMLHQRKARVAFSQQMAAYAAPWTSPVKALAVRAAAWAKQTGLSLGTGIYRRHFRRLARLLGLPEQLLVSQKTLSTLAAPYYSTFLRGGEGHMEVGKTPLLHAAQSMPSGSGVKALRLPALRAIGRCAGIARRAVSRGQLPLHRNLR